MNTPIAAHSVRPVTVGLVGGFSAAGLFLAYSYNAGFRPLLYATVTIVGTLVGLEIPLLLRILRDRVEFRELYTAIVADFVAQAITLPRGR